MARDAPTGERPRLNDRRSGRQVGKGGDDVHRYDGEFGEGPGALAEGIDLGLPVLGLVQESDGAGDGVTCVDRKGARVNAADLDGRPDALLKCTVGPEQDRGVGLEQRDPAVDLLGVHRDRARAGRLDVWVGHELDLFSLSEPRRRPRLLQVQEGSAEEGARPHLQPGGGGCRRLDVPIEVAGVDVFHV
ncbi:hypothetical protein [Pseudonocardia sp. T1-2H]|uniref:hypothetical protein n=1 Tax=Pseudonocardia sp. T1-2H TaxID=3128899 RepID=UPI0031016EB1